MPQGQGEAAHKREVARIEHGSFNVPASQRIGPVQHDERDLCFGRLVHGVQHGGFVGIEADPQILDIEDQSVYPGQHFRRWPQGLAVQTENTDSRGGIARIGDIGVVFQTSQPVFRRKERDNVDARGAHDIDIAAAEGIQTAQIGNEPHLLTAQKIEITRRQDIQTSGDRGLVAHRFGRDCGHQAAQRRNRGAELRVD